MSQEPQAAMASFKSGLATPAAMCNKLLPYKKRKVPSFQLKGDLVLFASPDSTYAVTRPAFQEAKKSILIGIYDLTAAYVKEWMLSAMQRGVKVSLMLDVAPKGSDEEAKIFRELKEKGCEAVPAPSCASKIKPTFHNSHEKVIVVDDRWCFVQSGNYSRSSIPRNEPDGGQDSSWVHGNRDMGILYDSAEMSAFFTEVLRKDMKIVTGVGPAAIAAASLGPTVAPVVASAPKKVPTHRPSRTINLGQPITVQPVLTPDNYLDAVEDMLEQAKKSVLIEQQYIRDTQPAIQRLLKAIVKARSNHPALEIRIIVAGPSFGADPKIAASLKGMAKNYGLKTGTNVRLLNNDYFAHCHNKLIIVDGETALVSSQNWSETAVETNREAGVIVPEKRVAEYFTEIFDEDWKTALSTVPKAFPKLKPASALATGTTVPVTLADYEEV